MGAAHRHIRNNVVAYVALFLALTGSAYAASLRKNSVGAKQLKTNAVTSVDVKDDSITGADVDESTLTLPAGAQPDTPAQLLGKLSGVDGAGSGLDADTIDGLSSDSFLDADAAAGGDLSGNYPNPSIGPNAVGSAQVTDNTLFDDDLAPNSVGDSEFAANELFDQPGAVLNDATGGAPTDTLLVDSATYNIQIIGRCDEPTAGNVQAKILYKTVSSVTKISAIDSTAQGGVNDVGNLAHNTEGTLLTVPAAPDAVAHAAVGDFTAFNFRTTDNSTAASFIGIVAATTNLGPPDCRFEVLLLE